MKIVVIGAVAGGTSASAKVRRNDESAEIKIFERDKDISYSGCGLPYYIGTEIEDREELTPRDSKLFKKKYNIDIFTEHEVQSINASEKFLVVKNLKTDEIFNESFDKLIISTGAKSVIPSIKNLSDKNNVFTLRNVQNAENIRNYI